MTEYGKVWTDFQKKVHRIKSQLTLHEVLGSSVANGFLNVLRKAEDEFNTIDSLDEKNIDALNNLIIPYIHSVVNSLESKITQITEGFEPDSTKKFEILLQEDALKISDYEGILEDYHDAVSRYFDFQEKISQMDVPLTESYNAEFFNRECQTILSHLDKMVIKNLGISIKTPANFDPFLSSGRQGMNSIFVGMIPNLFDLKRTIAHEGSFGHQLHANMSLQMDFSHQFKHLLEGLAVFGEKFAMKLIYEKETPDLCQYLSAKRDVSSLLYTIIPKLIYFDKLSAKKTLKLIDSRYLFRTDIKMAIKAKIKDRDFQTNLGDAHYAIGYKKINAIYQNAIQKLQQIDSDPQHMMQYKAELIINMFSGHRPHYIVEKQTNIYVKQQEHKLKQSKKSI